MGGQQGRDVRIRKRGRGRHVVFFAGKELENGRQGGGQGLAGVPEARTPALQQGGLGPGQQIPVQNAQARVPDQEVQGRGGGRILV